MVIGIDFDNTIVCYDQLFHKVARERDLIPADLPVNKSEVRNYLRRIGKEDVWTEMQGYVYGGRMAEAAAYPGALEFFTACRQAGIELRIVSHKTRYPFAGEQYDLHQAAKNWLELQGFFDEAKIGLSRENVFFELTKAEKLQRIGAAGCTHFIDDLPEILAEPSFPAAVEKILFDPADIYAEQPFRRFQQWEQIKSFFGVNSGPTASDTTTREKARPLLVQHGFNERCQIELLRGGGNNRVYRVSNDNRVVALKEYFKNPADSRDRFGTERAFYNFLFENGIRCTPERLGWDDERRLGLFSFVEGRKLAPGEVNGECVQQALDFIVELNRHRTEAAAQQIPVASEACFRIGDHIACVDRRIARLQDIEVSSQIDSEASIFICDSLLPAWQKARTTITKLAGSNLESSLSQNERCLSPSDFGFHNALLSADGRLRFFDFEYAGWDDPAKLVCDFFCQPQIPVAIQFWDAFVKTLSTSGVAQGDFVRRAEVLLPAYQLKWCCIILNEFVRTDRHRRDFAQGTVPFDDRKIVQLQKARQALRQLKL